MLKIHLVGGQSCEGKIFAVDPVTSAIVLQFDESGTGTSSFKLINSSRIVRIEGDMSTVSVPNISAFGIRYFVNPPTNCHVARYISGKSCIVKRDTLKFS